MQIRGAEMGRRDDSEVNQQGLDENISLGDPTWTRDWTSIALEAAASLVVVDDDHFTALRKASQRPTKDDRFFCPTATCQVINSLIDCGIEFATPYDFSLPSDFQEVSPETTSEVKLSHKFPKPPHYGRFISLLMERKYLDDERLEIERGWLGGATPPPYSVAPPPWLSSLLCSSRHFNRASLSLREVILYSNLLRSIQGVWKHLPQDQRTKIKADVEAAVLAILFRLHQIIMKTSFYGTGHSNGRLTQTPPSTYLLLHAAYCATSAQRLFQDLSYRQISDKVLVLATNQIRERLNDYFDVHSHRMMAKRWAGDDFQYDVVSMACAIAGWDLLDDSVRTSAFFRACVDAIARGQLDNGCWPDGPSIVVTEGGETIQIPSVEVAWCLGRAAFKRDYLVGAEQADVALMQVAYPALRRHCQYLASSRQMVIDYAGWTSDRTRIVGDVETWITTSAAGVFHTTYLIERALRREQILQKYAASRPLPDVHIKTGSKAGICAYWDESVIEPESISHPILTIRKSFLAPIEKQERAERTIVKLRSDDVSMLLYGPPGSGKTHLISTLSKTTGWPLIELNPGNFIVRGLEFIEAVAGQIFRDLCSLEHAIVFFDECDELFKNRGTGEGQARNIASFVTASMLPKLQRLHDSRRVIFVVATNYLQSVDEAIRRPGRFDHVLLLDRPHSDARTTFIKLFTAKRYPPIGNEDLARFVDASRGLTIPEIQSMLREFPRLPSPDKLGKMRADYDKWCKERWSDEAAVAGLTTEQIEQIAAARVRKVGIEILGAEGHPDN